MLQAYCNYFLRKPDFEYLDEMVVFLYVGFQVQGTSSTTIGCVLFFIDLSRNAARQEASERNCRLASFPCFLSYSYRGRIHEAVKKLVSDERVMPWNGTDEAAFSQNVFYKKKYVEERSTASPYYIPIPLSLLFYLFKKKL